MATHEDTEQEAERYRRAAEETLDQLDWCEDYLYRIGKPEIAALSEAGIHEIVVARIEPGDVSEDAAAA